jgi:peptidoglycan/LPS O-acetylase OafA/YrhL
MLWLAHTIPSFDPGNRLQIPTGWDIVSHLTMVHGFVENHLDSIISVFWSLSLEFQLYIFYPLFLFLFRKYGVGRSVVLLTIVSLVWRYLALNVWGYGLLSIAAEGPFTLMGCVLARMPEWLLGAFAAELFARGYEGGSQRAFSVQKNTFNLVAVLFFAAAVLSTLEPSLWVLTDILFGLSFASLVMRVIAPDLIAKKERQHRAVFKWLVWVGLVSYSLYLFHLPLAWILESFLRPEPGNVLFTFIRFGWLLLSLVPIYLLFRLVERPFLKPPAVGERWSRLYLRLAATGK